ncbi:hypothetical protein C8R44DRAFT_725017 [Mycena epipterygia]|nr:hypothetical protein C8R44DRAFT_725017 [Mycena epipterygia]
MAERRQTWCRGVCFGLQVDANTQWKTMELITHHRIHYPDSDIGQSIGRDIDVEDSTGSKALGANPMKFNERTKKICCNLLKRLTSYPQLIYYRAWGSGRLPLIAIPPTVRGEHASQEAIQTLPIDATALIRVKTSRNQTSVLGRSHDFHSKVLAMFECDTIGHLKAGAKLDLENTQWRENVCALGRRLLMSGRDEKVFHGVRQAVLSTPPARARPHHQNPSLHTRDLDPAPRACPNIAITWKRRSRDILWSIPAVQ